MNTIYLQTSTTARRTDKEMEMETIMVMMMLWKNSWILSTLLTSGIISQFPRQAGKWSNQGGIGGGGRLNGWGKSHENSLSQSNATA